MKRKELAIHPNYDNYVGCTRTDCIYHDKHTETYGCDYIGMTGHARTLICGIGDSCTVYKSGADDITDAKKFKKVRRVRSQSQPPFLEELKALHAKGYSDKHIAEELEIKVERVKRWRGRLGLEQNEEMYDSHKVMKILYDQGMTDYQISVALGRSRKDVWYFRQKYNLPSHSKPRKQRENKK